MVVVKKPLPMSDEERRKRAGAALWRQFQEALAQARGKVRGARERARDLLSEVRQDVFCRRVVMTGAARGGPDPEQVVQVFCKDQSPASRRRTAITLAVMAGVNREFGVGVKYPFSKLAALGVFRALGPEQLKELGIGRSQGSLSADLDEIAGEGETPGQVAWEWAHYESQGRPRLGRRPVSSAAAAAAASILEEEEPDDVLEEIAAEEEEEPDELSGLLGGEEEALPPAPPAPAPPPARTHRPSPSRPAAPAAPKKKGAPAAPAPANEAEELAELLEATDEKLVAKTLASQLRAGKVTLASALEKWRKLRPRPL